MQLILDIAIEQRAISRQILRNVTKLQQQTGFVLAADYDAVPLSVTLPLDSLTSLLELEEKIDAEEGLPEQLMNKFLRIGGNDYRNHIKRCLKEVFTNQLGSLLSWTGQKKNYRISHLKLIDIMKRSNQQNFMMTTDKMFEVVVAEWLRFSKQRWEREKERNNKMMDV